MTQSRGDGNTNPGGDRRIDPSEQSGITCMGIGGGDRYHRNGSRSLMGKNFWAYGIEANRKDLELVMRYTYEQGMVKHRLKFEELFHPSTMELEENIADRLYSPRIKRLY